MRTISPGIQGREARVNEKRGARSPLGGRAPGSNALNKGRGNFAGQLGNGAKRRNEAI